MTAPRTVPLIVSAADLAAIEARHQAYRAAFNDTAAAREAWCNEVAGTAIDCTGDIPVLVAAVRAAEAREAELRARLEAVEGAFERYAVASEAGVLSTAESIRTDEAFTALRAALAAPSPQEAGQ